MTTFPSLPSRLTQFARTSPGKTLFEYVDDRGRPSQTCSYAWFEERTRLLAGTSKLQGLRGRPVLLVYPPGTLDFIVAFVACLRAGVVAVPVYPPRPTRNKDLAMFVKVQGNCGAKTALTSSQYNFATKLAGIKDAIASWVPTFGTANAQDRAELTWPEMEWIVTDKDGGSAHQAAAGTAVLDSAQPHEVAFLQYTSGSTSDPKGVVLTHGNLAHNLSLIIHSLKAKDDTVVVSWLPQYHDMGLIGSHLGTLYCGGQATILSPISFVKNPPLWLELASARRATHLQAPNFAYRLTVRKFAERNKAGGGAPADLDLSSVRHVFNAAEPIDATVIDEFLATFAPFGFKPEAMVPGYGLAEHTVYVCDGGKQRLRVNVKVLEEEDRVDLVATEEGGGGRVLVGCGRPNKDIPPEFDVRVRIVDKHDLVKVGEDRVGEIWISSPSASREYFGLKEKSETDLRATMKRAATTEDGQEEGGNKDGDDDLARMWIRTGDLGFFHQDELFICGRIKDMLIVRGRNHFPQDIELTVERVDRTRLRPGTCAAFSTNVGGGEERIGVAVEVREAAVSGGGGEAAFKDLLVGIRASVAREHGVGLYAVVLLPQHGSEKTTSGKISRHRARKAFENDKYEKKPVVVWVSGETDLDDDGGGGGDGAGHEDEAALLPPRTTLVGQDLLDRLVAEAVLVLEREQVDPNTPLADLGFDSMALTQYKSAVLNALGVDIPDEVLFDEATTLGKVKEVLEGAIATTGGGAPVAEAGMEAAPGGPPPTAAASASVPPPPSRRRRKIKKPGEQDSVAVLCYKCLCCKLFT